MDEQIPVWWLPDGWSTSHVVRPGVLPRTTLCGRRVGDRPMAPAAGAQRCGQCRVRNPFVTTTGGTP